MEKLGDSSAVQGYRPHRLSRVEVERQGRWMSFGRAVVLLAILWLVQFPAWMVAQGFWGSSWDIAAEVPARIALLIDFLLIPAYVRVAYRAYELVVSSKAPRRYQSVAKACHRLVLVGAGIDLLENTVLWFTVGGEQDSSRLLLGSTFLLWLILGALLIALTVTALLSSPGFWWKREGETAEPRHWVERVRKGPLKNAFRFVDSESVGRQVTTWRQVLECPTPEPKPLDRPKGTIICCSGGGIRSASFCLGGLQVLTEYDIYQKADAVVGVSGGGYIAAAHHVLRWRSETLDDAGKAEHEKAQWVDLDPAPYSSASPELMWLRRHTRYLFESARVATLGLLSLLFGIAVNLVVLTALLLGAAWGLSWFMLASGGMTGWLGPEASGAGYGGEWAWVRWLWLIPVIGIGLFLVERFVERFLTWPHGIRSAWRVVSTFMIWIGVLVSALALGLPKLLQWTHNWAASNDSAVAGLVYAIGLVPEQACAAGGCGQSVLNPDPMSSTPVAVSIATVITAVLAVAKAAKGNAGDEKTGGTVLRKLGARVWAKVRDLVVPWTASVLIVVALLTLLLRWTAARLGEPGLLARWDIVYWFALALLVVKVFTDANRTSLHYFYRERLSYAFFVRRSGARITPLPYQEKLRFSQARPPDGAGPHLVSCAVANVSDIEYVPADRNCTPFVFDHDGIGLTDQALPAGPKLSSSRIYEYAADSRARDVTVAAAIAISGAALSPLAGRNTVQIGPYRFVLALGNARLGVWLPNPLWVDELAVLNRLIRRREPEAVEIWEGLEGEQQRELFDQLVDVDKRWLAYKLRGRDNKGREAPTVDEIDEATKMHKGIPQRSWWYSAADAVRDAFAKPGVFRVAQEAFGSTSVLDRRLYVTDGGHYDNLGLVEALRRRPKDIYVLDASADPEDTFRALGEAIATARIDLDVEVTFDPRSMRRVKEGRAKAAWGTGTARYSDGQRATIHLVKVVMLDNLPWDTETYAGQHPTFPRTSTSDQLYGEFDLEAYRILGREVTRKLVLRGGRPLSHPHPVEPSKGNGVPGQRVRKPRHRIKQP